MARSIFSFIAFASMLKTLDFEKNAVCVLQIDALRATLDYYSFHLQKFDHLLSIAVNTLAILLESVKATAT